MRIVCAICKLEYSQWWDKKHVFSSQIWPNETLDEWISHLGAKE